MGLRHRQYAIYSLPMQVRIEVAVYMYEDNIKMDLQEVGCGGYALDRAGSG